MKTFNFKKIIGFCSLMIAGHIAHAQNKAIDITHTAVPFLQISPDARAGGMGEAGMAVAPDAAGIFYNVARTAFAQHKAGVTANYAPWMKEVATNSYLASLGGYVKTDKDQAFTASLRYFSMGDADIIDYSGNKLQTVKPREYAIDFGYARQLHTRWSLGAAMRYISSDLVSGNVSGINYKKGSAIAADVSVYYTGLKEDGSGWTAGLSATNWGSKISYSDDANARQSLPASINAGAAYTENWVDDMRFTATAEMNKVMAKRSGAWQAGLGVEWAYQKKLYLRLGFRNQNYEAGNWQYITTGLGLQLNVAAVNLSFLVPTGDKLTRNPMAGTIRLAANFDID